MIVYLFVMEKTFTSGSIRMIHIHIYGIIDSTVKV